MNIARLNRNLTSRILTKSRSLATTAVTAPQQEDDEYSATPQYPPILDLSVEKKLERKRATKSDEIRNAKTVEEKQLKINMPRYYGFKSFMFIEERIPYNSLSLAQHVTRTHLIKTKDLPEYYQNINVEDLEIISKDVQETLLMEIDGIQRQHHLKNADFTDVQKENYLGSSIVKSINRALNNVLVHKYPHIKSELFADQEKLKGLRGTGYSISNDLCEEDRKELNKLREYLKKAREENKQAKIKGLKLEIEGKIYTSKELKELYSEPESSEDSSSESSGQEEEVEEIRRGLSEAEEDFGGMDPDESIKKMRGGHEFLKQFKNDPVDKTFSYVGSPSLTIRAELPLPYVLSPSEADNPSLDVPFFEYDPRVLGMGVEYRHAANIPGFWPGDSHTFGLTSYLKTGHLLERVKHFPDENDTKEASHHQAIMSSYAWLHSQANHLGFTTFNDITYPMVTQTVLTNGKNFQFYIYQLNTILLHSKNTTENPKRNICWASDEYKLYEGIQEGKLIGFNEEVLKNLVKLYSNAPSERLGVNLRPYLSQEEKLAADYEDEDKRRWLEKEYKFLTSNRPRLKELDEVYAWEKIYKVDHKTRLMDKKRRFFELFEKPWTRTLDARLPEYIPRALRPDLPRHKGRRAKEYWP
ncbi:unnamed protein product [Ceutorhynchus assimilis]|uniref:28S ribosomal protein S30, mitochondrial n=1 Tax=Ceutorhynchus assimilis TaxID=467358 RepID=A0A9N9QSF4_9CUCU|nr:unnamed protein product [Ceutorhynchus assimilis]